MTMDMRIANTPILMANPGLLEYFEKYAQDFLAEMDRKNEFTRSVTKIILRRLTMIACPSIKWPRDVDERQDPAKTISSPKG